MKVGLVLSLILLPLASFAQTYTQTAPAHCTPSDYVCNQIPLNVGSYSFVDGSRNLKVGDEFALLGNYGTITEITEAPPTLQACSPLKSGTVCYQGSFSFTFAIGSQTGTVSGTLTEEDTCSRYCYPEVWIESSTVTVN